MSWQREGDTVTLTMSVDDWERVLMLMGVALGGARRGLSPLDLRATLALVNRLNEGNPGFRPYEIPEPAESPT